MYFVPPFTTLFSSCGLILTFISISFNIFNASAIALPVRSHLTYCVQLRKKTSVLQPTNRIVFFFSYLEHSDSLIKVMGIKNYSRCVKCILEIFIICDDSSVCTPLRIYV